MNGAILLYIHPVGVFDVCNVAGTTRLAICIFVRILENTHVILLLLLLLRILVTHGSDVLSLSLSVCEDNECHSLYAMIRR